MKQGDDNAFDLFVHKYYQEILSYCHHHCFDKTYAEDLTQETFIRFFTRLPDYHYKGKTLNYLYTIAGNLCKDYLKKTKENNTATGWRDGHFHFDYLPLQEIARELSNAFHVKIKITDEDIKDFRIRAHFTEGESLDQMLDLLQSAGNFSYAKANDTILIHSKLN